MLRGVRIPERHDGAPVPLITDPDQKHGRLPVLAELPVDLPQPGELLAGLVGVDALQLPDELGKILPVGGVAGGDGDAVEVPDPPRSEPDVPRAARR